MASVLIVGANVTVRYGTQTLTGDILDVSDSRIELDVTQSPGTYQVGDDVAIAWSSITTVDVN